MPKRRLKNICEYTNRFMDIINFIRSRFFKNVALLEAGNIFEIGLTAVTSIVIARFLGPSDYGLYSLAFAAAGTVFLFFNLGQNTTALTIGASHYIRKDKKGLTEVFGYLLKTNILLSLFIGVVIFIGGDVLISKFYVKEGLAGLVKIIILTNIVGSIPVFVNTLFQISQRFKNIVILEGLERVLKSSLAIGAAIAGLGAVFVVAGYLAAVAVSATIAIIWYLKIAAKDTLIPEIISLFHKIQPPDIKKYFTFGILVATDKNLSKLFHFLPFLFLGIFAEPSEVGFLKIAFAYISIPLMMLSPVSRILITQLPKEAAENLNVLKRDFIRVSLGSFLAALILIWPLLLAAPFLLELLYGHDYLASIKYMYPLGVYATISALGVGLGSLARTLNKVRFFITVNSIVLVIGSVSGWFLIERFSTFGAVTMIVFFYASSALTLFFYMIRHLAKLIESGHKTYMWTKSAKL